MNRYYIFNVLFFVEFVTAKGSLHCWLRITHECIHWIVKSWKEFLKDENKIC